MKTCSKCKTIKPVTEFHKAAKEKSGLCSACKECNRAYSQARKDTKAEYDKAWRTNNAARLREADKARNELRRGYLQAKSAEYYAENRERMRQLNNEYAKMNKAAKAEYDAKYRIANLDRIYARQKGWNRENPSFKKRYSANRRAQKAGGVLSKSIADTLYAAQKGLCACCRVELRGVYHLDHIMPLALGGTNTDDNIQLLTPRCNLQKNAKHPEVFMRERAIQALC